MSQVTHDWPRKALAPGHNSAPQLQCPLRELCQGGTQHEQLGLHTEPQPRVASMAPDSVEAAAFGKAAD